MLGQAFFAVVPFVKAWWISAALWLWETLEVGEDVVGIRDWRGCIAQTI
jgi:hypothetical protein